MAKKKKEGNKETGVRGPWIFSFRLKSDEVKADLYFALLNVIKKEKHSSKSLAVILDEQQPRISNLVNRQLDKLSIEKLLTKTFSFS